MEFQSGSLAGSGEFGAILETRRMPHHVVRWIVLSFVIVVVLGSVVAAVAWWRHAPDGMVGSPGLAVPGKSIPAPAEQQPWGQIECVPILIAPPVELIPEYLPHETREIVWHFPNTSHSQFTQLLVGFGLPDPLRMKLASLAQLDGATNGVRIRPPHDLVLAIDPESRSKLYVALAEYEQNFDQMKAFRFCGATPDEWFAGTALSAETKKLVTPLIYRHGRYMFFADLRAIEALLSSPAERLALVKALSREATFLVKLKIDSTSDIEALIRYWGRRGQAKDIRPILESLAHVPGGETISIIHLLPPFARQRVYTYPVPPERDVAIKRDCHWTAFNFFSTEPDDRFCDEEEVVRALDRDYYRVYGDLKLGDLAMFFTGPSRVIHSAVYVADDILYTKNGSLSTRPWMMMRLDDLKDYYPSHKPVEVRYYRRKDI